jgi:hypothetical protein
MEAFSLTFHRMSKKCVTVVCNAACLVVNICRITCSYSKYLSNYL